MLNPHMRSFKRSDLFIRSHMQMKEKPAIVGNYRAGLLQFRIEVHLLNVFPVARHSTPKVWIFVKFLVILLVLDVKRGWSVLIGRRLGLEITLVIFKSIRGKNT